MNPTVNGPADFAAAGAAAAAEAGAAAEASGVDLLHESAESESAPENSRRERREARSGKQVVVIATGI